MALGTATILLSALFSLGGDDTMDGFCRFYKAASVYECIVRGGRPMTGNANYNRNVMFYSK